MSTRDAHDAFYSHKRAEHDGHYRRDCSECARLWQRYLAASREGTAAASVSDGR